VIAPLVLACSLSWTCFGQPSPPPDPAASFHRLFRDAFLRRHLDYVNRSIKFYEEQIEWFETRLQKDPKPSPAEVKKVRELIALLRGELEDLKQDEREIVADLGINLAPMPREK
jgi:hypothetical protein